MFGAALAALRIECKPKALAVFLLVVSGLGLTMLFLEITEDYTMAYSGHCGFRASTCTPFYFYDLDYEIQTPLKVFPIAVMDVTLASYQNLSHKRSYEVIMKLAREVQKVEGSFISLFHNETLSNKGIWRRWKKLYIDMLKQLAPSS